MENLKEYINGRISHANKRVKQFRDSHGDNPNETHTYHGGWSLGYWEGLLSAYEKILDEIEDRKVLIK